MITSFGSDGSDSEDENNSSDEKKTLIRSESEIGPAFCPPKMQSTKNSSRQYKLDAANISNSTSQSEQPNENKIAGSESKNNVAQGEKDLSTENKNRKDTIPKLDLNVSLVPGYGDDSDGEEEVRPKPEIKPLFPISQDEDAYVNTTNSLQDVQGTFPKSSSSDMQDSDRCSDNSGDRETKDDPEKMEEKEPKTDGDKTKTNIFLEDMQMCGKAFQRKKRIAFDGNLYQLLFLFTFDFT